MKKPERQTYFLAIIREHRGRPALGLLFRFLFAYSKYRSWASRCQGSFAEIVVLGFLCRRRPIPLRLLSVLCPARTMQHGASFHSRQVSILIFELTVDEDVLDAF